MSKELEALERIKNKFINFFHEDNPDVECIEDALTRLEQIDNAKPSEALEELNAIKKYITYVLWDCDIKDEVCKSLEFANAKMSTIEQALLKAQEQDFNYKNIVIPFFDELVRLLGTNDTDEMLDKIKEQEKENARLKEILINGFRDKNGVFHKQTYLAFIDDEWCICDLKTDEWFLVKEVLE